MLVKKSALCLALAALPFVAVAGTRDPGVYHRQHYQGQRIQQGVSSGELTRGEAHRLRTEQRHIRHEERAYKADGHLTRAERADLHRDQNHASRDIYRQKHDAQHRPPAAVRDPGVNARQHHHQDRIAQGVRSGSLTKDEAHGLRTEQRSIRQEERAYKADGTLTRDERKDLHQDLNTASRNIYNEKHDAETR
jgi:CRISPR/Cas system-associated endoribonuclease Cas2